MAVTLIGTSGYFTRMGLLLGAVNQANTFRYTTLDTRVTNILAQYLSNEQNTISNITDDQISYRSTATSWLTSLQNDAINTTIAQVNRDTPLTSLTLSAALTVLISQMVTSGDSLDEPTVSVTPAIGSANYGTAKIAASLKDTDGLTMFMVYPETLTCKVTSDAGRGATAYQEPVQIQGIPAVDALSYLWPQGSGTNTSLSITNAAATGGIITDGNFSSWTTNTPTSWPILVGTPGTTILKGTTPVRGTFDYQIVGNGSQLTSIYQTLTGITPNTSYCLSFWAKRSSGAAAGVLRVRLMDGSNTTINDDASTANTISTTISSGLSTSYTNITTFFVTPKVLPTAIRLGIDLTTALTNAETVDISLVAMPLSVRLYPGGPFVGFFSGATQSALNDSFTIAVANNGGTTKFIPALQRFFNLISLNLKFPTNASGTISDGLIT